MSSDDDASSNSFKLLLLVGVFFCVGAFKSWQDFRFATVGQQAEGTITKILEDRHRGATTGFRLYYDFFNENTKQPSHHYTLIDLEDVDQFAVGQQVPIDYYGEKYPQTRLHGTSNRLWDYFFFASLTALTAVIVYLAVTSARDDKRPRSSQSW